MGINKKEFYKRKIESIEEKIEELERDNRILFLSKTAR
jgi:hypothetical protein